MNVNRLTFSLSPSSFFNTSQKWRKGDLVVLLVAVILLYPVYYQEPFERQFTINDLTLSHPFAKHERVSDTMLFVYSFVIPLIAIMLILAIFADPRHRMYLMYISILGLCLSVSLTTLFTNFIKNWIGRLRPDFLARCEPKKGLPIDTLFYASDVCTTKNRERLLDGFRTTPSGHSSQSFSGLGYFYLWFCGQMLTENQRISLWRKILAFIPLLGAALIALSRTQDYRHHFLDVILGSVLGYVIGRFIYSRYFPPISSPLPFKPLLDDSDVTLEVDVQPAQGAEIEPLTA
ncbi:hypothetical protein HG536_0E03420 [Torulaspora globosa]|uniref:Phosphatidic acid phosphatase type 2/haloperoxidase domain-containing protein n=1 Tax=Torulaspora globosa TaxID=48254 RepID=A0A7G3ZIU5_9SACH|nr:uncharacterized protein HG536_0E03420 [Torulaspora globosa]QLL33431.1 hypothetical protein HG536_0E03420 [Torulaspora globosa]